MGIRLRMIHGDMAVEMEGDSAQDVLDVLHGTLARREWPQGNSRTLETTRHTLLDAMHRYICDRTRGRTSEMYAEAIVATSVHVDPATVYLDEITLSWVGSLDSLMSERGLASSTRSIHLRNIRTAISYAMRLGWLSSHPFDGYRMPRHLSRHRALPVEAIRAMVGLELAGVYAYHRDMFLIAFGLIGISCVDLYNLAPITTDRRVEYSRAKTKRPYSIRVEPEITELIERHKGVGRAVDLSQRYANNRTANVRANCALKVIGSMLYTDRDGIMRPICDELSTYWARHSWATIAASIDIPKDTIAAALGHGARTVTDIYIDFDSRKIDEANRRVIDYVWHQRR
ncbi:MAG: phage integrase SAM-like domain-containing protein [Porphyromonadaceae bacterium]|nr:phage integrase SAM-like domain-containing protein [Porphyromonadaceae bacterium]